MFRWPSLNFASASSSAAVPPVSPDNGEILPDYYRFLDPLYSNRRLKPAGDYAPESYRDDDGHIFHSTYRFFPAVVPRNKRPPSEERPAYFQRFWDRVPGEPEYRSPSEWTFTNTNGQSRDGEEDVPHERTWLLFRRLRGGLAQTESVPVDDDGRDGILMKIKNLFRFLRGCFRDDHEPGASVA